MDWLRQLTVQTILIVGFVVVAGIGAATSTVGILKAGVINDMAGGIQAEPTFVKPPGHTLLPGDPLADKAGDRMTELVENKKNPTPAP